MSQSIKAPPSQNFLQKTLGGALSTGVTASATLNNTTGIQNLPGVFIVDRVNVQGDETASKRETIGFAGTSGSTVVTLSRGLAGSSDQDHEVGAIVEFAPDVIWAQSIYDALTTLVTASTGLPDYATGVMNPKAPTITVGSDAAGDLYYRGAGATLIRLAVGSVPSILVANASLPYWAFVSGASGSVITSTGNITPPVMATASGVASSSTAFLYQNAIINSSCEVAQRVTAPNLSTSYQYGSVDRIAGKATGTAVNAGTVAQSSSATAGTSGFAFKLAGCTITGSGIVFARYRMESKDAKQFKNGTASFSAKVYQDSGGSVTYTIYIRKANAADDFSAVTDIANNGGSLVSNTTATTISFANINTGNLGDVSNGIEIEIQAACGAVTTKNFEFTEFQFNQGATANTYYPKAFNEELLGCMRYYEKSYEIGTAPGADIHLTYLGLHVVNTGTATSNRLDTTIYYKVRKRVMPTFTFYDFVGTSGKISELSIADANTDNITPLASFPAEGSMYLTHQPSAKPGYGFAWTASAEL